MLNLQSRRCARPIQNCSGLGALGVLAFGAAATVAGHAALADIYVTFQEGAPKDRFVIVNGADCAIGPLELGFDLRGAPAGLIFDTEAGGAGLQVFQPFEMTQGGARLTVEPAVADGGQLLTLSLDEIAAGEHLSFTIDLDDAGGGRGPTMVTGAEIAGAEVLVRINGRAAARGAFDDQANAVAPLGACSAV